MDLKNLFIFFVLFIIQVSANVQLNDFVNAVSFDKIKRYLVSDSMDDAFKCYNKVREHYEDNVKFFNCEMGTPTKKNNNALKTKVRCISHVNDAVRQLQSIVNVVLKLQNELETTLEELIPEKVRTVIEDAKLKMQGHYIAYLSNRQDLTTIGQPCEEEVKHFDKVNSDLVSKMGKRFSDFEICMGKTN